MSLLLAAGLAVGVVACDRAAPPAATTQTVVRYEVTGMTCGNCEQAIQTAVLDLDGVVSCQASHETGEAIVTLADPAVAKAVQAAINDLQFEAGPPMPERSDDA